MILTETPSLDSLQCALSTRDLYAMGFWETCFIKNPGAWAAAKRYSVDGGSFHAWQNYFSL